MKIYIPVLIATLLLAVLPHENVLFAAPLFMAGQTLNPSCAPTDPDCTIAPTAMTTYVVADIAARDALTPRIGDATVVSGQNKTYLFTQNNAWQEILAPNPVQSSPSIV